MSENDVKQRHQPDVERRCRPSDLGVDTKTLDALLKDNRRVEAVRTLLADLREHRLALRAHDQPGDEDRVAVARIQGIIDFNWAG